MISSKHEHISPRSTIYSEASAFKEIYIWSKNRPHWQRDALRRRITNGPFDEEDAEELLQICLNFEAKFSPLELEHISEEKTAGKPVSLLSISEPTGINALAEHQTINFHQKGLTVIYGDNGSGKSGYVRILKDACRSRDQRFSILPNISSTTKTLQEANIRYSIGDANTTLLWHPDSSRSGQLPAISIFDTASARTHLEGQHHVAYTPFPMLVLRDLAGICDKLKTLLNEQVKALHEQTPKAISSPTISSKTAAGALLHSLSSNTQMDSLVQLVNLSDEETKRREALQEDLAGDPVKTVARLRSQAAKTSQILTNLQKLQHATNEATFSEIRRLRKDHENKASLAAAASGKLFSKLPIPDIGGEQWKTLWEAARKYSDEVAYIETDFPPSEDEASRCVLCQQPLNTDAIERQQSFEAFIKSTTKQDELAAKSKIESRLLAITEAEVSSDVISANKSFLLDELGEAELSVDYEKAALNCLERYTNLMASEEPSSPQVSIPEEVFARLIDNFDKRISGLISEVESEQRSQMQAELDSLDDRLHLNSLESDISAEICRQKEIKKLKNSIRSTAKNAVTSLNKELSDKLVTDALRSRFAREVQKLEVRSLPIEMKKEQDKSAESFFKVCLVAKPDEPIGKILSEGEHRCVALAAFLAELVTANDYSGIVFDDPMSSLDHLYRQNVAKRLVEEAQHRQVVIFTHDLTFLFEVSNEAEKNGAEVQFQTVNRRSSEPGYVEDGLPFKAKNAGQMESGIRSLLKSNKGGFDNKPQGERAMIAKGIIAEIRIAWEQGIADFIKPVVSRFDRSIKPNSLFKLLVLNESDIQAISSARSRLSNDVHASPETLNPEEVEHADMVKELNSLGDWLADIRKRQATAAKSN